MRVSVDRLLAETIPDGTFGGRRPTRRKRPVRGRPDPRAAAHRAALEAELHRAHPLTGSRKISTPERTGR
ncbi:hypothetical protein [Streptomyces pini]|uniref:Uncharacterized protein n=1 Tax=Streptomyces pini TaxID=1520580 RepID=A0A1I4C0A9_9ACTN|nr:hypothetical protein [Streptomyces pini]SFK74514.1 hypothetical protein SAMN05192584_108208 [Streptomyces pini]